MSLLREPEREKKRVSGFIAFLLYLVMAIGIALLAKHCVWFDWSR